jgi:hypothetical protein
MNEQERELDLLVAELEQENRLLRARNERLEREALAAPVQEPVVWRWHQAPVKTAWGHEMVVADLAIDKDHTVSIYCERDQKAKVEAMFTTPPAAQPAPVREDWGPGPHEHHSLPPAQPASVQFIDRMTIDSTNELNRPAAPVQRPVWDACAPLVMTPHPAFATPPSAQPCPTCEALARTVMMDQTAHDAAPAAQRQWVELTAKDKKELWNAGVNEWAILMVESKCKEKNQ